MSFQKGSSTTTQKTQFPEWYEAAAEKLTRPFAESPTAQVAGLTEDQMMAGNLSRQLAQGAFGNTSLADYANRIEGAGTAVTGDDIKGLMNPYLETVGRTVLNDMGREKSNANAAIGARNANAVAFGGSGAALERAQLERSHGQNVARAITDLQNGGWDRASALASANADRKLSATTAAYGAASGAANENFNRQASAIDRLLGYGTLTQAQAQKALDVPYTSLQRYASLVPGAQNTTTPTYFNPLEQLLGLGLGAAGIYKGFK
jgi:hypothetical protein